MAAKDGEPTGDVLYEVVIVGNAMRCAAIHADTGVEVVVVGPAGGSEIALKALAFRKLKARLGRE